MKTLKEKFVSLFDGNFYEEEVNNFNYLPKKTYKGLYLVSIFEKNYDGYYCGDFDYSLNIYVCYANELLILPLDEEYDDDMVFKYKDIQPEPENDKSNCQHVIHYLIKKTLQDILVYESLQN